MKKLYLLIGTLLTLTHLSNAQVSLVKDLNPGTADGFDEWNFKGIDLNGKFILPAKDETSGLELFKLENGTLSLIKDIWSGSSESEPTAFTLFNGKVYFIATNDVNGREIWSTDGTETGTTLAIELTAGSGSTNPGDLIVGNDNKLYFTSAGKLYISNGTSAGTSQVAGVTGVDFTQISSIPSPLATPYKNGIAFYTQNGTTVAFYYYNGNTLDKLSEVTLGNFTDVFGLTEVTNGLLYATYDTFDDKLNGVFSINASKVTTKLLDESSNTFTPIRVLKFTNQKSIFKIIGQGAFYATDGTQANTVKIAPANYTLYQGEEISHAVVGNKMVFFSDDGGFFNKKYAITDGTVAGTSVIATTDFPYQSPMITSGNKVFWAIGTSNGFNVQLWMADVSAKTSTKLFEFTEDSNDGPSVIPIVFTDNKLYFNSNLKGAGRELYSYTSSVLSVNKSENPEDYKLIPSYSNNTYSITSTKGQEIFQLEQYDLNGRLVKSTSVTTNEEFYLGNINGVYLLSIKGKENNLRFKVILN